MSQTHLRRGLSALLLAVLAGCASPPPSDAPPLRLRLIAFNDFHGNLESTGLTLPWPDPSDRSKVARLAAGGAAPLARLVHALRQGAPHSLVVSSGDLIGGTPLISALFLHESTAVGLIDGKDTALERDVDGCQRLLTELRDNCRLRLRVPGPQAYQRAGEQ